ncbi:MAG: DUF4382 domain-containing protein [Gammaproteobacteria bacterium]|nr:DUF4382 domain-containing protein [Gammaproteobacteria bacterium]
MNVKLSVRLTQLILLASLPAAFLSACGGGSTGSSSIAEPPASAESATGTVGLLFTDKPTEEFSEIKLTVLEAILIGGEDGQQTVFDGLEPIDLLDLENFSEPVVFGEVRADTYTKLRLIIDSLELVPKDGGDSIFPALPANGKIDLLDADGFAVLPGRSLLVEVDMDANKSIKITGTGNSRKYNFRPVVKVKFTDEGLQDKLARVEGTVTDIPLDPGGSFTLCDIETPDSCIDVATGDGTSIFDDTGVPADFTLLTIDSLVTVIGRYEVTEDVILNALVVEVGGNAEQVKGQVVSEPAGDKFLVLAEGGSELVVELQFGAKFFDAGGETGPAAVVIGSAVEIEGVRPEKENADDPDLIRAALVFVESPDADQVSGTIQAISSTDAAFDLLDADGNTIMITVADGAGILLVNTSAAEVTQGDFSDLAVNQVVELFGTSLPDARFETNEIIVVVTE